MNRQEFIKTILEAMCFMAEFGEIKRGGSSTHVEDIEFKSFKPTLADRLLFRKIIETSYEDLMRDLERYPNMEVSKFLVALNLLNIIYASNYLSREERVLNPGEAFERYRRIRKYRFECHGNGAQK